MERKGNRREGERRGGKEKRKKSGPGCGGHAFYLSTWKAEAGKFPRVSQKKNMWRPGTNIMKLLFPPQYELVFAQDMILHNHSS